MACCSWLCFFVLHLTSICFLVLGFGVRVDFRTDCLFFVFFPCFFARGKHGLYWVATDIFILDLKYTIAQDSHVICKCAFFRYFGCQVGEGS